MRIKINISLLNHSFVIKMTVSAFAIYITNTLGRHKTGISVATSATLAIISFFYIYTLGSYLKIGTSVLHDFYNYVGFFHLYVISKYVDHIIIALGISTWFALSIRKRSAKFVVTVIYGSLTLITALTGLDIILDILALLSIPLLILILACNRFLPKMRILSKNVDTDLSSNYIIITGLVISTASIIASLTPFFSVSTAMRNYAYEIFVLLSSFFSPIFIALLVLCIPVKLLFDRYVGKKNKNKNKLQYATKNSNNKKRKNATISDNSNNKDNRTSTISRTKIIFYLSLFMLLSSTMTLIPHQPAVNKDNRPIGADIQDYTTAIEHLSLYSNNPQELIRHAFVKELPFYGDRPVSLLLFFTVVKTVSAVDPTYVIDYMPIILGPALVLAVFFLMREMTSNDTISILAAFMTAVSFQVLVGIYSGFYANWFALIIGYFSFVFLFKFLKRPSKLSFITYSLLVILLLLSHVYTWTMVAVVSIVFLLVMLKFNYYRRKNIILLLLVVSSPGIVDAVRTVVTGSIGGISSSIQFASQLTPHTAGTSSGSQFAPQLGLEQLASFRTNLLDSTEHFLGGLFGNFIILALGLYWLFRANRAEPYNIFIMIFLSLGIVPLFFSDWILQTRVFYNIPFQIPAAIGLYYIIKQHPMKGMMILIPICIWLIAVSIVDVSNFYPVLPHTAKAG
ncbi:MAG: hypothetical protein M3044_12775 [Thermoproteota archaeon]|nr:hypothetical protein [Thermoproteota archaeon]